MPAAKVSPDATAKKLLAVKSRPAPFVLRTDAPRAPLTDEQSSAYVTRGKRAQAAGDTDPEYLIVVNGERMTGITVAAIAHAIVDGVITRAEVESLLALL